MLHLDLKKHWSAVSSHSSSTGLMKTVQLISSSSSHTDSSHPSFTAVSSIYILRPITNSKSPSLSFLIFIWALREGDRIKPTHPTRKQSSEYTFLKCSAPIQGAAVKENILLSFLVLGTPFYLQMKVPQSAHKIYNRQSMYLCGLHNFPIEVKLYFCL